MASRMRYAAMGLGLFLSTAVIWSGCNESRELEEEEAGSLRDLRSTLQLEIQSVDLPETGNPTITFRAADEGGDPIDDFVEQAWEGARPLAEGEQRTPPFISPPRFVIAMLGDDGDYVDYYTRNANGSTWQPEEGGAILDPVLPSTVQANFDAPPTGQALTRESFFARFTSGGNGVYTFQLNPPQLTEGMDRTKTHTAAMWATRTTLLEEGQEDTRASPANATRNFVPAGGNAALDEVVTDAACNACHGVMSAHDNRTGVQLCITCHSPQTTDPETGNTVDFKDMIHRIHFGSGLPSVAAGTPYRIVGRATATPAPPGSVHDYSEVTFPRDVRDCRACHQGEDAENYRTRPAIASCVTCHDNVRFEGEGLPSCAAGGDEPCLHVAAGTADLSNCAECHTPSVIDAQHSIPGRPEVDRYAYEILDVDVPSDRMPVITFRVVDPTQGNRPYDLRTDPTWNQTASGASRLHLAIAYPANEFANEGGGNYGQPIDLAVIDRPAAVNVTLEDAENGAYRVKSPVALPANVASAVVFVDGHPATPANATSNPATRIPVPNVHREFAVDGQISPRREIVTTERCDACHGFLTFHGNNRNENVLVCATCHNANATDRGRSSLVEGASETSIDFKWMIHAIHAGGVRETEITIYGFGQPATPHTFPLPVPFDVGDCNTCHVNDSWQLPLEDFVLGTTRSTGENLNSGADNERDPPATSSCLSCHDSEQARDHAFTYVEANGVETCADCHGSGGIADVARVHPIRARDDDE